MEHKKKKRRTFKKKQIITIIVAIITSGGTIIAAIINARSDLIRIEIKEDKSSMSEGEGSEGGDENYMFSNVEEKIEGEDGFSYVECHIVISPVSSYRIMVYPYLSYQVNQEDRYILLEGLYTQDQYLANEDGTCLLKREDVTESLENAFAEELDCDRNSVKSGCLIVIGYDNENQTEKKAYVLKSGQLQIAEDDLVESVIGSSQSNTIKKFNMKGWPGNRSKIKEII